MLREPSVGKTWVQGDISLDEARLMSASLTLSSSQMQ